MKKTIITAASLAVLALGGCAGTESGGPGYSELRAQAVTEIGKAKKMNALWRDTEKMLKQADAARGDMDNPKAMKLVKKALKQAKLAQKQAQDQANAGPSY